MKRITIGILAHVDAGKTTLSEALLFSSGAIRKTGRVDHGDAFLDTDEQEKRRGITIFSKQAVFRYGDTEFTLLDTPGHVDFSAEAERVLQVLDAAVLVVSAPDGVQSHTVTLWNLLKSYRVPVFVFVNKMDQPGTKKDRVLEQLKNTLKGAFLDFSRPEAFSAPEFQEELAVLDETLLDRFLEEGTPVDHDGIVRLVRERKLFPCFFGSALRQEGVDAFLSGLDRYAAAPEYPAEFGAKVFKISRDAQGTRLTFMKITGGTLKAKMMIPGLDEKADQLRLYSGARFTPLPEAEAGTVLAVTGLTETRAGEGLGFETGSRMPILSPVLAYRIVLPDGTDAAAMLPKFRALEEEEPELHILWDEQTKEIHAELMGAVQTEVLKTLVKTRWGVDIGFDTGNIAYRETIADTVEGVGHCEPLRHYAEVHLILSPGEPGSGLRFETNVRTDKFATNWQRLVMTHLEEKEHVGVLTGSPITDMKIEIAAGKAHEKHTEGGDFRQATYRAVRNGLMQAESVLLEPWYSFSLEVPQGAVGRAMTDLDRMCARFAVGGGDGEEEARPGFTLVTGEVPVSEILNYADDVRAYTKGEGRLDVRFSGYKPCHNAEDVIIASGYDPELDVRNSPDSVFCSHGVGTVIPWYEVKDYMHVPAVLEDGASGAASGDGSFGDAEGAQRFRPRTGGPDEILLSVEEIDAIIDRTFNANRRSSGKKRRWGQPKKRRFKEVRDYSAAAPGSVKIAEAKPRTEYLLVDGYNIIFAWEDLKALAALNIDSARLKLQDILADYQGYRGCELIVVFDAYRVAGHPVEILDWDNIHIVFTKEAQTADSYIEQFSEEHAKTDRVIVATSDGLEQIIVRSAGSELLSAQDLREDILRRTAAARETHLAAAAPKNTELAEKLAEIREQLEKPDDGKA